MSRQLEIKKLYKADGEDERVVIKVLADCDLGDYIITDATSGIKGGSSNLFRHVFEFPTYLVEKGDWVVLYTKKGKQHKSDATHFFYWNSGHNVWNDEHDTVTLIKVAAFQRKSFSDIIQA
jgi:hypothetical protein